MTAPSDTGAFPRLALAGVFGGLFCGYLGLSAAIPVLPAHVRDQFGAGDLAVGLAVTATALTALLTRPIFGGLADKHGHRSVMRFGALAIAAGGLLYFLPIGFAGLMVARLLAGVGEAALFVAGAVWTVSLAPHSRRGQVIGLYGVAMWGGISLGTALGAVLRHFGIDAVWAFCVAAPLVGLVLISIVPPQPHVEPSGGGRGLMLRPAVLPGLGLALGAAGYVGLAAFVITGLQERGIDSGVIVLSTFSAVYAGTRLVIGHLPDKLGPRRVASWCGAGEAAGLLIIAWAPNLPVAVLGAVVMGVGFSLLHPSLALMVMNNTESSKQGAALGAYTSFWDLGLFVWGPATGAIATGFGYPAVFVVGAACALAASVLAMTIRQSVITEKTVDR
ncbi:MFS transporter [Nocardia sp. NPDC051321]|uniref:MFS transporter n=1 Tax=Nocardia sp. NPDC051321 TaxID=3364323 RepID=UPI0037A7ACD6